VFGSVVRVNRQASAATGCSAPFSSHFRAGADTGVAERWQAGGRGQARAKSASRRDKRRRSWLPGEALVELEGRGGQ